MKYATPLICGSLLTLTPALGTAEGVIETMHLNSATSQTTTRSSISSDAVAEAFELRIDGKADEARERLELILGLEPENEEALYELARTQFHMALGRPQELVKRLDEARATIDRAASDSTRPEHHLMAGLITYFCGYIQYEMDGASAARENFGLAFVSFERALELKPDLHEAKLYLVEFLAVLPEAAGGDWEKAETYTEQLEAADAVFGAKARFILTPGDSDRVEYWKSVLENHKGDAEVLAELGKAHMYQNQYDQATRCFERAFDIDARHAIHFLDLARFHMSHAMGASNNPKKLAESSEMASESIEAYLKTQPCVPMRAYATRGRSILAYLGGEQEEAKRFDVESVAMDPYVSLMSGTPQPELFAPVSEVLHQHRYMLRHF